MKFNVIFLENNLRMTKKKDVPLYHQRKNKFNQFKSQDYDTSRTTNTHRRNQKQNR